MAEWDFESALKDYFGGGSTEDGRPTTEDGDTFSAPSGWDFDKALNDYFGGVNGYVAPRGYESPDTWNQMNAPWEFSPPSEPPPPPSDYDQAVWFNALQRRHEAWDQAREQQELLRAPRGYIAPRGYEFPDAGSIGAPEDFGLRHRGFVPPPPPLPLPTVTPTPSSTPPAGGVTPEDFGLRHRGFVPLPPPPPPLPTVTPTPSSTPPAGGVTPEDFGLRHRGFVPLPPPPPTPPLPTVTPTPTPTRTPTPPPYVAPMPLSRKREQLADARLGFYPGKSNVVPVVLDRFPSINEAYIPTLRNVDILIKRVQNDSGGGLAYPSQNRIQLDVNHGQGIDAESAFHEFGHLMGERVFGGDVGPLSWAEEEILRHPRWIPFANTFANFLENPRQYYNLAQPFYQYGSPNAAEVYPELARHAHGNLLEMPPEFRQFYPWLNYGFTPYIRALRAPHGDYRQPP